MGVPEQWLGWGRALAGMLSPDTELLTSHCCSCFPELSPRKAGVQPGILTVQELPQPGEVRG